VTDEKAGGSALLDGDVRPTTVMVVDDHALVREGVCGILKTQEDLRVVGQAGDSATAVALATEIKPDIVLLDIEIPGEEATVKRFSRKGQKVVLQPANERLEPMVYDSAEVQVFGKVVTVLRRL